MTTYILLQSSTNILRKVNTKYSPKTKYLQESLHLHPEVMQYYFNDIFLNFLFLNILFYGAPGGAVS